MAELPEIVAFRTATNWANGFTCFIKDAEVKLVQVTGVYRRGKQVYAYAVFERDSQEYAYLSESFTLTLPLQTNSLGYI